MNGRLYDPKLHRFLQPDNYIQDPTNTQNFNRYGYVLNNPLKYTDPSGEKWKFNWADVGAGAAIVVGAVLVATGYGAGIGAVLIGAGFTHFATANNEYQQTGDWDSASNNAGFVFGVSFRTDWGYNSSKTNANGVYQSESAVNPKTDIDGGGKGNNTQSNGGSNWAAATLGFITADATVLEPTDSYWPKWAVEGVVGLSATAYLYSGDYISKMQREIEGIKRRTLGPPGFVYELVATKNGFYPNLNTGGTTYLNIGDVWKYGQTTKGFGRYPDNKIDLVRDNLKMIPLPPGGNQMEILIQEKYYIYGYYFLHGHRPPGNSIFR